MKQLDKLPNVAVAATKFIKGVSRLVDATEALNVMPLRAALAEQFVTDAHFVSYVVHEAGAEAETWPRLNKVILDEIEKAGGRVSCSMFVIDIDTKDNVDAETLAAKTIGGKVPWDDELIGIFWAKIDAAVEAGLPMPNALYTTNNGARCIYVLPELISVRESEELYRGLVHLYGQQGIIADSSCADWTRMFRMPSVMRDNKPTWEQPHFKLFEQYDTVIDLSKVPKIEGSASAEYAPIKEITDPRPTHEDAQAMLEVKMPGGKGVRQTALHKESKRRLQGRNCFPALFDFAPLAREGERDVTLTKYVGEAVSLLYYMDGCTPEFVYALFLPAVEQLQDAADVNWLDKLWYLVRYTWAREVAKHEAKQEKAKIVAVKVEDKLTSMLNSMRKWCDHGSLHQDDARSIAWMLQHAIVMTRAKRYHVLRHTGYYSRFGVPREHLLTEMRESGLSEFIELDKVQDGEVIPKSANELLAVNGTQVHEVEGAANYPGSIVKNIATSDAKLVVALYCLRRDIVAEYNERVDQWLIRFVGKEHIQDLRNWIGFALDFEGGPVCALSLSGPPSCGKKMLVRGLAECINTGAVASGLDLVQRFTPALMKTPFLCVDEGLPSKVPGGIDIADQFRRATAGESLTLDVKFGDPITVFNPLRVIFTANNLETVRAITSHRDLTPEDQAALGERIFHLDVMQEAADFLAANGGRRMTKGWIQGDSGEPSDHVVAKHFLWLYENRPKEALGTRLLMQGNLESDLMRDMRTQSGAAPLVIRTLIYMLESASKQNMKGLSIENGEAFVTASGVHDCYKADLGNRRELNTQQILNVLRSVVVPGATKNPTWHVNAQGERIRARWHPLDLLILLEEAYTNGYPSKQIEVLVRARYGDEAESILEGFSK